MRGLFLEPPPVPVGRRSRNGRRPGGFEVATSPGTRTVQGALVGTALAASLAGLLGADAGLLWVVAGVWTVRRIWGRDPGLAWGIAIIGAGIRWRTLSLPDIGVATRALGPTVAVLPVAAVVAATVLLIAAVIDEARLDGLRSGAWPERVVSGMAIVAIAGVLVVPGPAGALSPVLASWAAAVAVIATGQVALARAVAGVPGWALALVSVAAAVTLGATT